MINVKQPRALALLMLALFGPSLSGCSKSKEELIEESCDNAPENKVPISRVGNEQVMVVQSSHGFESAGGFYLLANSNGVIEYRFGPASHDSQRPRQLTVSRESRLTFVSLLAHLRPNSGRWITVECQGPISTDGTVISIWWGQGKFPTTMRSLEGGCKTYAAKVERCQIQNAIQALGIPKPHKDNRPWF